MAKEKIRKKESAKMKKFPSPSQPVTEKNLLKVLYKIYSRVEACDEKIRIFVYEEEETVLPYLVKNRLIEDYFFIKAVLKDGDGINTPYNAPVKVFEIKIVDEKKFLEIYEKKKWDGRKKLKIGLKSVKIEYIDEEAVLEIGDQRCEMPPYKNEHYFCQAMYDPEVKVNTPVSWDRIYEVMTGSTPTEGDRREWRKIYDAMEALNNRIKKEVNTDDELFTWKRLTAKRNY